MESPAEKPDWQESDEDLWAKAQQRQDVRRGWFWFALIVLGYVLLHNFFQHTGLLVPT
jgi:hypothetical protein